MKTYQRLLGLATTLIVFATSAFGADILPSYDNYDRWLLACDNGLRCEARGMSDRSDDPRLSILREAGPEGGLTVTIAAVFRFELTDLAMDGVPLNLDSGAWTLERHSSRTAATTNQTDAAQAFIQQIRNGNVLEFGDRANKTPLDGLTAALLRMDEIQRRLGTQTALIRRGGASADTVPLTPPLPIFERAEEPPSLKPKEEEALLYAVQEFHANPLDDHCYGAMHLMTPITARAWPIDEAVRWSPFPARSPTFRRFSLSYTSPTGLRTARSICSSRPCALNRNRVH